LKYEHAIIGAMFDTATGDGGDSRGVTPVVGGIVLVAVTVVLALSVGAALTTPGTTETPSALLSLTVDGAKGEITLTHRGGDTLDVSELDVRIEVDGTALAEQPPVPFVGADGFDGTPTGPFNAESPDEWRAGERAGFRVADTNAPLLSAGSGVTVVVATDGGVIQEVTARAR
jgi:flagellin-like protein